MKKQLLSILMMFGLLAGCSSEADPAPTTDSTTSGGDTSAVQPQETDTSEETDEGSGTDTDEGPEEGEEASTDTTGGSTNLNLVFDSILALSELNLPDDMEELNEMALLEQYGIDRSVALQVVAKQTASYGIGIVDTLIFAELPDEETATKSYEILTSQLEGQKNQTRDYDTDAFAILEKSLVRQDGTFVALIITDQAKALESAYEGLIK